jgi:prevent-host-death family protein
MRTLPLTEARAKLSSLISSVEATGKAITITRNGKPAAVLLSAKVYEGWNETIAIQSDPRRMRDIRAGLRSLNAGTGKLYTLDEFLAEPAPRRRRP